MRRVEKLRVDKALRVMSGEVRERLEDSKTVDERRIRSLLRGGGRQSTCGKRKHTGFV